MEISLVNDQESQELSVIDEAKKYLPIWMKDYCLKAKQKGYVIGVSGGIDSAVCSTLCAMTGLPTIVVRMSIHQDSSQADRGQKHIDWLKSKFPNVQSLDVDLTSSFDEFDKNLLSNNCYEQASDDRIFLARANTRSRLRMVTLYSIAGVNQMLVCGTGNKIEDYGIGFFTKFGDGGVDISPIGELIKTQVYALGSELGIIEEILTARPTDGLWDDGRTDEDQIGATYEELEWTMIAVDEIILNKFGRYLTRQEKGVFLSDFDLFLQSAKDFIGDLSERELELFKIYIDRHLSNAHKLEMPPTWNFNRQ